MFLLDVVSHDPFPIGAAIFIGAFALTVIILILAIVWMMN